MRNRVLNMISEVEKVIEQIPELTHLGNPILRQKCKDVSLEQGKKTSEDLIKILKQYQIISGIGVGLAAPQIGKAQRVFITYDKNDKSFQTFLNPKILDYSKDHNYYRESCLSSRFLWADIKRPVWVKMAWTDLSGNDHTKKFKGHVARLIQHEYDHLEGVPCTDIAEVGTIEYSGDVIKERIRAIKSD